MGVNHTIGKQPLKRFRYFLPESLRGTRHGPASGDALNEVIEGSYDAVIADATSVIIGSDLPVEERNSLRDGFVNYIKEMCLEGHSVMAIAVAFE